MKHPFNMRFSRFAAGLLFILAIGFWSTQTARAADAERIETFLEITGFDASLESIQFSAGQAPAMLGLEPDEFGTDWTRLAESVFDPDDMRGIAMEILTALLDDDMLDHAVAFYDSDLGRRLVVVENEAHLSESTEEDDLERARLLAEMEADPGNKRLQIFERMLEAIDSTGNGVRALQEIQVRFLMAASLAGVIELRLDEDGLRAMMAAQEDTLREVLRQSALESSAFTYRTFSNEDLEAYVEALEHPTMQKVYELLNGVQYQITANRFEVLANRMADLHPSQDI